MNRFLSFDENTGVLECEAGVTFQDIVEVFLPRGFFLYVTPGTKFVTVGGAIANDVHGKNHHREGTIAQFVLSFRLMTPTGEVITCSPESSSDVFWATVGGVGLTGIILTAKLRLRSVESTFVEVVYEKARHLNEALDLFSRSDDEHLYSVAWIDCLARGKSMGRSVLARGSHAVKDSGSSRGELTVGARSRIRKSVPLDLPSFILNPATLRVFNSLYYAVHRNAERLVQVDAFFYPLDSIYNWNRMYGSRGFIQYQLALPLEASQEGLTAVLRLLSNSGRAAFLAVLKRFGGPGRGILSFPVDGYTLALDIPLSKGVEQLVKELDRTVLDHGGRVYLAKDSMLDAASFAAMYPRLGEFRAIQRKLDPDRLMSSSMARRLSILEVN